MRIATYTRISTDEAHQPHSLGAQADRLAAYCASQEGWRTVAAFQDQMTGTALERPGLGQALAAARAGRFELLLVFRVDRLARSVRTLATILAELDEAKVAFRSATEPFDTTSPAGRMMVQMLGVFAEFERATIIERVVAGMEKKARQGAWVPGTPPIGYTIGEGGFLQPAEPGAALVQRIFALYTEKRLGTRALAQLLNREGERTQAGSLWSGHSVQAVLANPAYIGAIRWRKETFPAPHQPLVSRQTFDEANGLLKARGQKRPLRRSNSSDYLLTGLARCGNCGAAMVGTAAHGRNRRYRYYTCHTRHRYGTAKGCHTDRIPAPDLEDAILHLLAAKLADTGLLERALATAGHLANNQRPKQEAELTRLQQELRKREHARDRYLTAFERGTLPEEACGHRLRTLTEEIDQLQARHAQLATLLTESEPAPLDRTALQTLRRALEKGLPAATASERKHLLRQAIHTIEIRGRDWIRPTLRLPVVRTVDREVDKR